MTENKRFDFKYEYITLGGGFFATAKDKHDAELISRTLNQLYDESEELKHQVNYLEDRLDELFVLKNENNDLKKENDALKEFVKVNFSDMMAEKMEKELKND